MLKSNKLFPSCIFLNKDKIIRVSGKLRNASTISEKTCSTFQAFIYRNHNKKRILDYYMRDANRQQHHCGNNIDPCKFSVKKIIEKYIKYFQIKPRSLECVMDQLFAIRITPAWPFSTCDLDYADSFPIRERIYSNIVMKSYLYIILWMALRANIINGGPRRRQH